MSELVTAAPDERSRARRLVRRASRWTLVVGASVALLAAGAAVLAILWATSAETRTTVSRAPATVLGIELHVQSGDVTVVGGGRGGVTIARTDHRVYGRAPREARSLRLGILRLAATCPALVLGSCASDYRIELPDNVPISIRAERGSVRLDAYRGSADVATNTGSIRVDGFCGFVLGAASASGDVRVRTACSPQRLALRSDSGDVSAVVPAGNYRIDAVSGSGSAIVSGLSRDSGAPWSIQAFSNSGDVRVAAGS